MSKVLLGWKTGRFRGSSLIVLLALEVVDRSQKILPGRLDFFLSRKKIALIRNTGTVRCLKKLKVISLLKDASNRFYTASKHPSVPLPHLSCTGDLL